MSRWRRVAVAIVTIGGLLLAATGCGSSITVNGAKLVDPQTALDAALDTLKADNDPGIQNGSITVSSATSCFYVKAGAESEDITKTAACGPIRRLGEPYDKVWDTYDLQFAPNSDGDVTASVAGSAETAVAMDTSLLVSGGDTEPAAVDEVPKPQPPPTTITDTALTVPTADGLGSFTPLEKPARLITPAGTIEVTDVAEPEFVPQEMVDGAEDPSGVAPYYRPAEGQKLYAYKVKIGPGAESTVPASTADADSMVNLDTTLSVGIGDQSINIKDSSGGSNETLTLNCEAENYGTPFPCSAGGSSQTILLMTVPAEGTPSLVASVNGDEQSVDLSTGELTSSVSRVEYDREKLTTNVGKTLKGGPVAVKDDKEVQTASWSMDLQSVSVTAFDAYRGWAPDGQAWLIIGTEGFEPTSDASGFTLDRYNSFSVSVDGKALEPDGLTDAGLKYARTINWAYRIPADATKVTVSFQPTGDYRWTGDRQDFIAKTATTYDVSLPS